MPPPQISFRLAAAESSAELITKTASQSVAMSAFETMCWRWGVGKSGSFLKRQRLNFKALNYKVNFLNLCLNIHSLLITTKGNIGTWLCSSMAVCGWKTHKTPLLKLKLINKNSSIWRKVILQHDAATTFYFRHGVLSVGPNISFFSL